MNSSERIEVEQSFLSEFSAMRLEVTLLSPPIRDSFESGITPKIALVIPTMHERHERPSSGTGRIIMLRLCSTSFFVLYVTRDTDFYHPSITQ